MRYSLLWNYKEGIHNFKIIFCSFVPETNRKVEETFKISLLSIILKKNFLYQLYNSENLDWNNKI